MAERDSKNKPPVSRWGRFSKIASLWVLIFLVPLILIRMMDTTEPGEELDFSQFSRELDRGNVERVVIVEGRRMEGNLRAPIEGGEGTVTTFTTDLPVHHSENLITRLEAANVEIGARDADRDWWSVLIGFLPWILIIGIWIFIIRQMQAGGAKAFQFGKSKAKMLTGDTPKVTFDDVAGADEAKYELQEIVEFLKDPKKFSRLGGRIPKGALLVGPPGTGKTLLARAVAGEAGRPFFQMSGSDFVEMFVGVGASRVRDLFEQGKAQA
nr:ATP-dependent metallopeptidase FtsH/Yme1/Tma family protein [Gemmatimonadota bacterium]